MQKFSLTPVLLLVFMIISLTITSCTQKMGCYFGYTNVLNRSNAEVSINKNAGDSDVFISTTGVPGCDMNSD